MEPKHYVCAVIWRRRPASGAIEFLVQDGYSTNPETGRKSDMQTKFPGGMQRLPTDRISVTLPREILEETYLSFNINNAVEIWRQEVFDRRDPTKLDHTKHAFLVSAEDCTGELRTETITDANDEILPPYWEPAETLGRKLFHTHQPILLAAMRYLDLL